MFTSEDLNIIIEIVLKQLKSHSDVGVDMVCKGQMRISLDPSCLPQ